MNNKTDHEDNKHKQLHLQLMQEFRIMHLLYHRNKNQHCVARWWRYFNMLKRNCAEVLEVLGSKRPQSESQLIRLFRLMNKLIRRESKKIYFEFNGIISLGQFVTLGVVLLCVLGRVYSIYGSFIELYSEAYDKMGCGGAYEGLKQKGIDSIRDMEIVRSMANEELGEDITNLIYVPKMPSSKENALNIHTNTFVSPKKITKKGGKKKKKAKSAIDGIFG